MTSTNSKQARSRNAARVPVALSIVLLLSACGPTLHWEHPATGQQNLAADMEDCRRLADAEAWRYYRPPSLFGPFTPFPDRHGHRHVWRWDPFFYDDDRFFRAAELRDFCLRSRGYRLVPDEARE